MWRRVDPSGARRASRCWRDARRSPSHRSLLALAVDRSRAASLALSPHSRWCSHRSELAHARISSSRPRAATAEAVEALPERRPALESWTASRSSQLMLARVARVARAEAAVAARTNQSARTEAGAAQDHLPQRRFVTLMAVALPAALAPAPEVEAAAAEVEAAVAALAEAARRRVVARRAT